MKLDRNEENTDHPGRGKYALLKLRQLEYVTSTETFGQIHPDIVAAIDLLEENGLIDWGITGTESEFFVIRLKDKYAMPALAAYADAAREDDSEWASEVDGLMVRSGRYHPDCKRPD